MCTMVNVDYLCFIQWMHHTYKYILKVFSGLFSKVAAAKELFSSTDLWPETSLFFSRPSIPLSAFQINSEKRASAEMMKPKPKPQKKKKKKDPNEPQKPVSAYALFFRDTQAAIKGQNPNATFGDVSKIVASMWDSLGEEQKQVQNVVVWEYLEQ